MLGGKSLSASKLCQVQAEFHCETKLIYRKMSDVCFINKHHIICFHVRDFAGNVFIQIWKIMAELACSTHQLWVDKVNV